MVEKIETSEVGLHSTGVADVNRVRDREVGVARGEETEVVEAEQIITHSVEEETKTVVTG